MGYPENVQNPHHYKVYVLKENEEDIRNFGLKWYLMLLLKNVPIPSSFRFDGFRAGIPSGSGSLNGISGKFSESASL